MFFLKKVFWNVVFIIFFPLTTFLVLFTLALFLPFPQNVRDKIFDFVARSWGKASLIFSNTKLKFRNIENVPETPPYLIVFNHGSSFDIYTLFLMPRTYRAVMKKELLYVPIFGVMAWLYGHIPIDRKNLKKALVALEKIKGKFQRYPIFMAITGTRVKNKDFHALKLKKGPVMTSLINKIPILPITVLNADKVHWKGLRPITPGLTIEIVVHPIVNVENYTIKDRNVVLSQLKEIIGKPIIENN